MKRNRHYTYLFLTIKKNKDFRSFKNLILRLYLFSFFSFLLVYLFPFTESYGQVITPNGFFQSQHTAPLLNIDSLHKKRFWLASGEFMASQLIPWSIDQYVRKMDYTHISWQTVSYNLSPHHWAWDGDGFITNEFGHPYHGSLFYNSFRVNGYSFWESMPAAFAGSYLWETFSENQAPAPNDFINTGFGGIIMGEMTYRLANKIINNKSRGVKRQISEIAALIINPVNGITRILDGKWGKFTANSMEHDSSKIYAELDAGMRQFSANKNKGKWGVYGHVKFLYGMPYEKYKTPFSNIAINAEFGKDDSSKINMINVYGSIRGWRINNNNNWEHLLVLSANYDFINNEAFFYSGQSIKLNLYSTLKISNYLDLNTLIGAGPVILGAVPNNYEYEGRVYDFCSGVNIYANCYIKWNSRYYFSAQFKNAWLKTLNGNASDYYFYGISGEIRVRMFNNFYICAEPGYSKLLGHYANYPNSEKTYPFIRAFAKYVLNFE